MGQFDWLFYKFPKEETQLGEMLPPVQAYFHGELSVPGSQVCLPYRAYRTTGIIEKEAHYHREEEYLAFVGHDLRNAFDSFDAEITFYMGEDRNDMEKIVITAPTMIRVPPLFWHGPLEITRLGKPLFFQPVLMNSRYYAIYRRTDAEGHPYKEALVHGVSPCRLNPDKLCSFCGKCRKGED